MRAVAFPQICRVRSVSAQQLNNCPSWHQVEKSTVITGYTVKISLCGSRLNNKFLEKTNMADCHLCFSDLCKKTN